MGNFVETWRGIAAYLNRSERWCRYMGEREQRPLPVFKVGGIVRMNVAEFEAWLAAERAAEQSARDAKRAEVRESVVAALEARST